MCVLVHIEQSVLFFTLYTVLQTTNEKASIHDRIAFLNEASVMK